MSYCSILIVYSITLTLSTLNDCFVIYETNSKHFKSCFLFLIIKLFIFFMFMHRTETIEILNHSTNNVNIWQFYWKHLVLVIWFSPHPQKVWLDLSRNCYSYKQRLWKIFSIMDLTWVIRVRSDTLVDPNLLVSFAPVWYLLISLEFCRSLTVILKRNKNHPLWLLFHCSIVSVIWPQHHTKNFP